VAAGAHRRKRRRLIARACGGYVSPMVADVQSESLGEEIANAVTHGAGLVASLAVAPMFLIAAAHTHDAWRVVGVSVFVSTLALLYAASTFYHALSATRARAVFQRIDHAAIYLLIAGTYTPFVLVNLRGPWGWTLFAIVWSLAAFGVALKSVFGARRAVLSTIVYIAMGWLVLCAAGPLVRHVEPAGLWWLLAGGVCYTGGVAFFAAQRLRFGHALWHVCVLAGSVCHGVAIFTAVLGA
jgi:hemolysin III